MWAENKPRIRSNGKKILRRKEMKEMIYFKNRNNKMKLKMAKYRERSVQGGLFYQVQLTL